VMAAIFGDTLTVPAVTTTVTATRLLEPPGPVQVSEYDVVAARAPVLRLPLVAGNAPLQPPEAAQAVALVELQLSVDVPPGATMVGLAAKVAVGAAWTVTVAVAAALVPPGPLQVSEYDVVAARAPVLRLPLVVGNVPFQPPPEAVQAVALVELQVSVDVPPEATVVGLAVKVAVGATGAVTETVAAAAALLPPGPLQVSEYDVVAVSAPVPRLPLVVGNVPLQPPEAVQAVALVELQVSVDVPPGATTVGLAVKVAVGAGSTVTVAVAAALVPPGPVQLSEYDVVAVSAPVL
jgi:hypothetical protein